MATNQNINHQQQVSTATVAPQQAVQEYLDALLQEATSEAITTTVAKPVAAPVEIAESAVEQTQTDVVEAALPDSRAWRDGRPSWAQQRFECLLFRVSGLTLAVPLVELGGVLTMDEELSPLFGQPDWFLGLLPSKTTGTVKAIDTARWVMPEKYTDASREGLKYVIRMEGTDWGMACHEVADAISLEPDQVKWRTERSQRPWLAGTVVKHMCAIMDVAALVDLLTENSRKTTAS